MKVILRENVASLGKAGDVCEVSDGYARNFLIPKGFALEASGANVQVLEREKQSIAKKAEKARKEAESLGDKLKAVTCTITKKVGDQDKLFGSVTAKDIEKALLDQGIKVAKKNIILDEPIKELGEFSVKIKIHSGIASDIKVAVIPEKK